jgi:threonine/homoserine/homoserine lactone efflux protein
MELTIDIHTSLGLFISLAILAAIPSISVLLVSSRAAVYGFSHGAAVALGIVMADILFISIALYGMGLLLPLIGHWELLIRMLAAAYLFWLAILLWRQKDLKQPALQVDPRISLKSSFLMGFIVTLADHKAILFYMGFFPAWVTLSELTLTDTGVIFLVTFIAVGGVKCVYAFLAATVGQSYFKQGHHYFNKLAAILLVGVGAMIVLSLWK